MQQNQASQQQFKKFSHQSKYEMIIKYLFVWLNTFLLLWN